MDTGIQDYVRCSGGSGVPLGTTVIRKPATLRDIALASGVGISAVSSVVNGARTGSRVSEAKRKLILETAQAMRYHPNEMARSLSRRSTGNVGILLGAASQMIHRPDVAYVLEGVVDEVGSIGRQVVLFTTSWAEAHRSIEAFCHGRVDGIIVFTPPTGSNIIAAIRDAGIPVVVIDPRNEWPDSPRVTGDDCAAMRLAVEHLLLLGHREIGLISAASATRNDVFRTEGVARLMAKNGLERPRHYNVSDCGDDISRREQLRGMIAPVGRPTALIVESYRLANETLNIAREIGADVPGDLSVVAIDTQSEDSPCYESDRGHEWNLPRLTAVRRPLRGMGRAAVRLLSSAIMMTGEMVAESVVACGESASFPTVIAPSLVAGASTGLCNLTLPA